MELGLSKCSVIHIQKGKFANLGGVTLRSGGIIQQLKEDEGYKYLGIEELVGILYELKKRRTFE